jgi:AcrR family transcriptional regulator
VRVAVLCDIAIPVPSTRTARRKAELLTAFIRYLLRRGVSDISLRPAAVALGTSPRMLIYYFGSRQRLLFAAVEEIRLRERVRFAQEIQRRPPGSSVREFLEASWRWYSSKRREPHLRLLFELYGLAFVNPKRYRAFLTAMTDDYFSMMEEGLRSQGMSRENSRVAATLYRAALRGLVIDLLSTGDRARIDEAVTELAKRLENDLERAGATAGATQTASS